MRILIAPFVNVNRNGTQNAKQYPYWRELVGLMEKDGHTFTQINIKGYDEIVEDCRFNLPLKAIKDIVIECDTWISNCSFLPHLAHHIKKKGIVLFSVSDPNIFGYSYNVNILKDRKYLVTNQYSMWELVPYNSAAFLSPETIYQIIKENF